MGDESPCSALQTRMCTATQSWLASQWMLSFVRTRKLSTRFGRRSPYVAIEFCCRWSGGRQISCTFKLKLVKPPSICFDICLHKLRLLGGSPALRVLCLGPQLCSLQLDHDHGAHSAAHNSLGSALLCLPALWLLLTGDSGQSRSLTRLDGLESLTHGIER